MDLSAWLLRHTPPRPLVVTTPGGTGVRLAVERVLRRRGWTAALSPAAANLLVVAGAGEPALESFVGRVWGLVPAPRARVDVPAAADAARALDHAVDVLHDIEHQRDRAAESPGAAASREPDRDTHEHGTHEHGLHEHDDHGQHGQHGHDMHGHDMGGMALPGGVPMADRAADRDGLPLDQLHVPLGPALPLWPSGLAVQTLLQGDVIQRATVELVGARQPSFWVRPEHRPARPLDASAGLLAVAGWADAAARARRLRDDVLAGRPRDELAEPLRRWARRVRRSRTLRWLLAGIGDVPAGPDTPRALAGDALARLHRWLDALLDPSAGPLPEQDAGTRWAIAALPGLLEGRELATARLLVASLDLDPDVLTRHEAAHG